MLNKFEKKIVKRKYINFSLSHMETGPYGLWAARAMPVKLKTKRGWIEITKLWGSRLKISQSGIGTLIRFDLVPQSVNPYPKQNSRILQGARSPTVESIPLSGSSLPTSIFILFYNFPIFVLCFFWSFSSMIVSYSPYSLIFFWFSFVWLLRKLREKEIRRKVKTFYFYFAWVAEKNCKMIHSVA